MQATAIVATAAPFSRRADANTTRSDSPTGFGQVTSASRTKFVTTFSFAELPRTHFEGRMRGTTDKMGAGSLLTNSSRTQPQHTQFTCPHTPDDTHGHTNLSLRDADQRDGGGIDARLSSKRTMPVRFDDPLSNRAAPLPTAPATSRTVAAPPRSP